MAMQTEPNVKRRAPLSRERVLRAALVLADAGGIDSMSMRKVGEELGGEAMSLYNHVANKEDILDAIVDLAFAEIALPSGRGHCIPTIRNPSVSAHDTP